MCLILGLLISPVIYWGCAGSRTESSRLSHGDEKKADTASKSKKNPKEMKAPESQYLVVRFQQNDTEVELALDPEATNLELDLKRGPDGSLQVMDGDSVLYDKTDKPAAGEKLTSTEGPQSSETLTDEIIQDINLAQKLFYERKYEEALRILRASLDKKPTATAYALGGSIYYVNGDIDAAVNAWQNALEINPNLNQVRKLVTRYGK